MAYVIKFYTDAGCKGNGTSGAIGAAAAVFETEDGDYKSWKMSLASYPTPTNERAGIEAIVLALEKALDLFDNLNSSPWLDVAIYSDSRYGVDCMTKWIYKWTRNGWVNYAGHDVANRDLLEQASDLDQRLRAEGDVQFLWIPREKNGIADRLCNEAMDEQDCYY
ncbi:ribonuclease H-like domain-containing protein [Penicillium cosmopolitanum]|uniref:ribonuclease H n=1 Tax=Penicillium cosmopolitanum TaxID=1131564 RepID=A0A9X0B824_9EURO|nr:ribonuclease H-like domain-containing protein [Penicillium cosmopolitanum]KAJ5391670.1 ribonuclease H-like domain-containing protein [Penicillium cosmopolitanum]